MERYDYSELIKMETRDLEILKARLADRLAQLRQEKYNLVGGIMFYQQAVKEFEDMIK